MPHPITTALAWAGRLLIALRSPSSVRLVGRADLLGQLVPRHPVAHPGPQLPLQRLGLRFDGRPQLLHPRPPQGPVDVQLVQRLTQLPPVPPPPSVHTPVTRPPRTPRGRWRGGAGRPSRAPPPGPLGGSGNAPGHGRRGGGDMGGGRGRGAPRFRVV